jgi:hypothetical protein
MTAYASLLRMIRGGVPTARNWPSYHVSFIDGPAEGFECLTFEAPDPELQVAPLATDEGRWVRVNGPAWPGQQVYRREPLPTDGNATLTDSGDWWVPYTHAGAAS